MKTTVGPEPASGWQAVPFALAATLTWISAPIGSSVVWSEYALSAALLAPIAALVAIASRASRRTSEGWVSLSSLVFLVALALLRDAVGGSNTGVNAVAMVPALYVALHTRRSGQLGIVLAGIAAYYFAPIVLVGPPHYPQTQYRAGLLAVSVAAIVGVSTQRLVASARTQAEEALRRGQMLEEVSKVARELYNSTSVRTDVSEAAMRIGRAQMAVLYERVGETRRLRSTALAGFHAAAVDISLDVASAVRDAFVEGRSILVTENVDARVGSKEIWRAAGSPSSVLYEPLVHESKTIGVLVVGWGDRVRANGPRATVVELLAHEAASAITRGDTVSELVDIASTDALTGLPNRWTWDTHLARASAGKQRFAIAMLDLDHFKEFNDSYGHPAGDRLLKEISSRWRHQLRGGDLLARIGGEEFGLLLLDCETGRALEIIERLREATDDKCTCSAGYAERRGEEDAIVVLTRADHALYEAKTSGRDRACVSG